MLNARVKNGICLIIFFVVYMVSESYLAFLLLSLYIGAVILSILFAISYKNSINIQLEIPSIIEKKKTYRGYLYLQNHSIFPIGKGKGIISISNRMTQEQRKQILYFSIKGKSTDCIAWDFESLYCGNMEVEVSNLVIYDFFGIYARHYNLTEKKQAFIIPDTFPIEISMSEIIKEDYESTQYSAHEKGQDVSELFGYKEYEPGDLIHHINWKLSNKWDKVLVKEFSFPMNDEILILIDTTKPEEKKQFKQDNPELYDAKMEVTISLSKALIEESYSHRITWYDAQNIEWVQEQAETQEDLFRITSRELSIVHRYDEYTTIQRFLYEGKLKENTHIIYITTRKIETDIRDELSRCHVIALHITNQIDLEKQEIGETMVVSPKTMQQTLSSLMV